jgi:SAM-dependent methyltransferase
VGFGSFVARGNALSELEIEVAGGDTATPLNLAKRLHVIERIAGPLDGLRAIDCGCGGGEYVRALRDAGAIAFGVEYQRAKLRSCGGGSRALGLAAADIQALPFPDGAFDLAVVNEVLEHVPDDLQGLREVHRVLAPGGTLVVFSPNRLYPFETHGVFLRGSDRKLPPSVPGIPYLPIRLGRIWLRYWARNYWPRELRRLIARAGFTVVGHSYVWQTFENISGQQPRLIARLRFALRALANLLERIPGVRAFGVSQAVLARSELSKGPP